VMGNRPTAGLWQDGLEFDDFVPDPLRLGLHGMPPVCWLSASINRERERCLAATHRRKPRHPLSTSSDSHVPSVLMWPPPCVPRLHQIAAHLRVHYTAVSQ
jgi:hypothetical protein